ncbi:MAG: hypothetical protein GX552_03175 [Chloroflexi bacterium]|nr:hypothetical protein [Chloroflexota bacterium]
MNLVDGSVHPIVEPDDCNDLLGLGWVDDQHFRYYQRYAQWADSDCRNRPRLPADRPIVVDVETGEQRVPLADWFERSPDGHYELECYQCANGYRNACGCVSQVRDRISGEEWVIPAGDGVWGDFRGWSENRYMLFLPETGISVYSIRSVVLADAETRQFQRFGLPERTILDAVWSPTASEFACIACGIEPNEYKPELIEMGTPSDECELWVIGGDGSRVATASLPAGLVPVGGLEWSPDGQFIALRLIDAHTARRHGHGVYDDLYVFRRETGEFMPVTGGWDRHIAAFAWSPDGKVLAYTQCVNHPECSRPPYCCTLQIVRLDQPQSPLVLREVVPQLDGAGLSWLPDGSRLLVSVRRWPEPEERVQLIEYQYYLELWSIRPDGSDWRLHLEGAVGRGHVFGQLTVLGAKSGD